MASLNFSREAFPPRGAEVTEFSRRVFALAQKPNLQLSSRLDARCYRAWSWHNIENNECLPHQPKGVFWGV